MIVPRWVDMMLIDVGDGLWNDFFRLTREHSMNLMIICPGEIVRPTFSRVADGGDPTMQPYDGVGPQTIP